MIFLSTTTQEFRVSIKVIDYEEKAVLISLFSLLDTILNLYNKNKENTIHIQCRDMYIYLAILYKNKQ